MVSFNIFENKSKRILTFLLNEKEVQENLITNYLRNNLAFDEFKENMLKSISKQSKYLRRIRPLLENYFKSSLLEIQNLDLDEKLIIRIQEYYNFQINLINSLEILLNNRINYFNSTDSDFSLNDYNKKFELTEKQLFEDYNSKQDSFRNYLNELFKNNKDNKFKSIKTKLLHLILFGSLSYILLINRDSEYFFEGLILFISVFGIDFVLDKIQDLNHKKNDMNEKYLELLNIIYNIKS